MKYVFKRKTFLTNKPHQLKRFKTPPKFLHCTLQAPNISIFIYSLNGYVTFGGIHVYTVPTKSKIRSRNTQEKNLIIASLLIIVLISSFAVYLFVTNKDTVHVKTEQELVKAINDAGMGTPTIITLDNDIDLTATIGIPTRKNITLTSKGDNEFKLVGADRTATLYVGIGGTLILDGIVVTHAKGADGCGVDNAGTLVMYSGVISGNTVRLSSGGGVTTSGVFEMYGGEIVNNVARISGGGVDINGGGVFSLFGGVISGNAVSGGGGWGGGVYRYQWAGTFNWYGGEIYGNTADNNGDVYDP
jgi:hypothetical protein